MGENAAHAEDALIRAIEGHAATPGCTDILINGTTLWVDTGHGVVEQPFPHGVKREDVQRVAIRFAALAHRRLDQASPIVDARMPQGWRLHAVIPPVAEPDTLISIRIPQQHTLTLDGLIRYGWEPWLVTTLKVLVTRRLNVLISGGTGTGKTTLLSAALGQVPSNERIVCIEEVPEIFPLHPHCVHMYERHPNVHGKGAIPLSELVRAAMRMRPDRIILGECRGSEVRDVMTALNTGHSGGWATLHANSAIDVPARLTALGALAGMSASEVAAQAIAAFAAVIHLQRLPDGQRTIASLAYLHQDGEGMACRQVAVRSREGKMLVTDEWDQWVSDLEGSDDEPIRS